MKKIFLFLVLFASFFSISCAQMSGGPKAGLSVAKITGDGTEDVKFLFTYHVGGFFNYAFSDMLSVQPELLYSNKGYHYKYSETVLGVVFEDNYNYTFSYIDIPVLLNIHFGTGSYIGAGPQLGILTNARYKGTSTVGSTTTEYDESGTEGFNTTEVSLSATTGYKGDSGIGFNLRGNFGMTGIGSDDPDPNKNLWIQASLSYAFGNSGGGRGGKRRR